jgi:integrase/recombinase XerD
MNKNYYSIFGPHIVKFIAFKQALGYKYKDASWALSFLDELAQEMDLSEVTITKELADQYGIKRPNESEKTLSNRVQIIGQFAKYLCSMGFRSFVPNLPRVKSTFTPYIFTREQIRAIFTACDELEPAVGHSNSFLFAIPLLIRLLYGTGLRVSEALNLTLNDVDLVNECLTLRNCKNGKDRIVLMAGSLACAMEEYIAYRKRHASSKKEDRIFVRRDGVSLNLFAAYKWFRKILYVAGISHGGRGRGPRLHDIRHSFACHSLASMAASEMDMYNALLLLSTYLGHQSLEATEGYVRMTAELYPDLINKASALSADVFPMIYINTEADETN